MHFLTLDQAQSEPFQTEYRYRIVSTLSAFLVCVAVTIASVFGAYRARAEDALMGVVILGWVAFWFALFALMLAGVLRARLRPANWLVRTQTNGLLVKFRSYLNHHFDPNHLAAVHIEYGDIEFARPHRLRQELPSRTPSDDFTRFTRFAEFKMRNENQVAELGIKLSEERLRSAPRRGRFIERSSKSRHYPLQVSGEGFVRIEWHVRPNLRKFMHELAGHIAVKEAAGSLKDFRNLEDATLRQQEDALLELIARGDRMSALHAVKRIYGYDTTRAVHFLEELSEKSRSDR